MTDQTASAPPPGAAGIPSEGPEPVTAPLPEATHPRDPARVALFGIFAIGVLFAIYFGRDVLLPIALAMLLNLLLRPVVRGLYRWGIPDGLGAAAVVAGVTALGVFGVYTLAAPAADWLQRMPRVVNELEFKMGEVRDGIQRAREASRQIEQMAQDADAQEVVVRGPSLVQQVMDRTQALIANVVITLVLLYFFLARGRPTLEALIGTMRSIDDRVHYAMVAATVQQHIAAYLATVTIINTALGCATAGAMWLIGLPNAGLWGTVAGVLNFIPFLGPAITAVLIFLVSVLTFDTLSAMLLPPAVFIGLTTLEGNFLTPMIVGRRLSLNPIAVFVSILFWGWMWGMPGALLAVPILAILKILCDAHEPLRPAGALLGS